MVDAPCETVIVAVPAIPTIVTSPDTELTFATLSLSLLKDRAPSLAVERANVNVGSMLLLVIFETTIVGVAFATVSIAVMAVGASKLVFASWFTVIVVKPAPTMVIVPESVIVATPGVSLV